MNTDIPMVDRRVSADDSEESIHDLQALTRAELQLRIQNYNEQQQVRSFHELGGLGPEYLLLE
jgi:hypothetical protein